MAEYIEAPIETDPETLLGEAYTDLAEALPGWVPADGNIEAWLLEVVTRQIAENRELATGALTSIYKQWGTDMVSLPAIEATPATATSTWTAIDTAGHLIEAGLLVGIRNPLGQDVAFEVRDDVTISPGSSTTAAGAVVLDAVEPGADGSGLTGPAALIDTRTFVNTITLVGMTTGGIDAETDDEYLARLTEELRLLTGTPILTDDFAVLYRRIPTVARAIAYDGYNPGDGTENNERMVAVAGVDELGGALSTATKDAGDALLEAMRETNFVVNIIDPTFTTIDVAFTAVKYSGFDTAAVLADAIAAVTDWLSPAKWGLPPFGDPSSNAGWVNEPTVRVTEIAEVLNRVEGLRYVATVTVGARKNVTIAASTNLVSSTAHGYTANDPVIFRSLTGGAPLVVGTTYYVRDVLANTFAVSATAGGAAIDVTTDGTVATVVRLAASDVALPGKAPLTVAGSVTGTVT